MNEDNDKIERIAIKDTPLNRATLAIIAGREAALRVRQEVQACLEEEVHAHRVAERLAGEPLQFADGTLQKLLCDDENTIASRFKRGYTKSTQ